MTNALFISLILLDSTLVVRRRLVPKHCHIKITPPFIAIQNNLSCCCDLKLETWTEEGLHPSCLQTAPLGKQQPGPVKSLCPIVPPPACPPLLRGHRPGLETKITAAHSAGGCLFVVRHAVHLLRSCRGPLRSLISEFTVNVRLCISTFYTKHPGPFSDLSADAAEVEWGSSHHCCIDDDEVSCSRRKTQSSVLQAAEGDSAPQP
ncbi:uncharacterized protein V6R79_006915 [Siganus canaliculatus]